MSGGEWSDPVDIGVEAVPTSLLTDIADNLRCLHKGNGQAALTTIDASGTSPNWLLDIGTTDESFILHGSGVVGVDYISTTGRQAGDKIFLICTSGARFYHAETSAPGGYAAIRGYGANGGIAQDDVACLIYSGAYWYHLTHFTEI